MSKPKLHKRKRGQPKYFTVHVKLRTPDGGELYDQRVVAWWDEISGMYTTGSELTEVEGRDLLQRLTGWFIQSVEFLKGY